MVSYEEALNIIRRAVSGIVLPTVLIDVFAVHGRVSAEDIISPLSIPPFDNSAMDGFAVRCDDFKNGAAALKLKTRVIAGDTVEGLEIAVGECCEIMTGAVLPQGADAIIPVEQSSRDGNTVSFSVMPQSGDHIRHTGSDFIKGAAIVESGALLGVQHVLPLASLGIGKVAVYCQPKIAFIPTGLEIIDGLDQPLGDGKIYNSNLPYAMAFLSELGAEVLPQATIRDDPAQFQVTVQKLMNEKVDLIVSSGAVSAGSHDFIRSSLEVMGAEILFHKVAIKPGKPVLFAKLPNGTLYLGLPGNPVATAAGLRFFVRPLLAAITNQPSAPPVFARLKTPLARKAGLRLFLKAKTGVSAEGVLEVEFLDGQESYKTAPFLAMNAWAVIPEESASLGVNDLIAVFPLKI
jgi:molybdopterin molybdotransferase